MQRFDIVNNRSSFCHLLNNLKKTFVPFAVKEIAYSVLKNQQNLQNPREKFCEPVNKLIAILKYPHLKLIA